MPYPAGVPLFRQSRPRKDLIPFRQRQHYTLDLAETYQAFTHVPRPPKTPKPRSRRVRRWRWFMGIVLAVFIVIAICVQIAVLRAEPILRTRMIETLSTRFKSRVELGELHVWVANGIHVGGKGLKIYGATDPNPWQAGVQPLLEIGEFRFQTALRNLFREPMHVDTIFIDGLTINIPPANDRQQIKSLRRRSGKMSIAVEHFICAGTKLIVNTNRAGKPPLQFDISSLQMIDMGPAQPLRFLATLVNPKPVGDIQSNGLFGPFNEASPRDTTVEGAYSFTHADLGTIHGIGGTLSSTGQYGGTLGRIEVNGQTDTPNFEVAVSGHPVPLHTDFHAIVDGTDGDTYLDPVQARVLHSSFTAQGKIVRLNEQHGHDIELNVTMAHARIEDLLQLGVKTEPPIMIGTVRMRTKFRLTPGAADIAERLKLGGRFKVSKAYFSNEKVQTRVNGLSLRGLGRPRLMRNAAEITVPSELTGTFSLDRGMLSFSALHFEVPGTDADMTGQYSLDGNIFDFHGHLKMDAKLSQMTTGWKAILLKPVAPFFSKHGAGTEIPFKITGTREEPHFGTDFGHKTDGSIADR